MCSCFPLRPWQVLSLLLGAGRAELTVANDSRSLEAVCSLGHHAAQEPGGSPVSAQQAALIQRASTAVMAIPLDPSATALHHGPEGRLVLVREGPQAPSAHGPPLGCRSPINAVWVDPKHSCPDECPFWAQKSRRIMDAMPCTFQCVASSQCGSLNANATVADPSDMSCRPCRVQGCDQCLPRGVEGCLRCISGYVLKDGQCWSAYRGARLTLYSSIGVLLLIVLLWYCDLLCRPIVNEDGLKQGLHFRSRTRLRAWSETEAPPRGTQGDEGGSLRMVLWPLRTNLITQQVAGPGLTLFFRFQMVVIAWAVIIAGTWLGLSVFVDGSLLHLGIRRASTPRTMCYVIRWGHALQMRLIWVKVGFLLMAYLGTFALSLAHAALQLRRFQAMDDGPTMKDYAALCDCKSMDSFGDEAEQKLQEALQERCGERIVGVSICWDFINKRQQIKQLLDAEMQKATKRVAAEKKTLRRRGTVSGELLEHADGKGTSLALLKDGLRFLWKPMRFLFGTTNAALGFREHEPAAELAGPGGGSVREVLGQRRSSPAAAWAAGLHSTGGVPDEASEASDSSAESEAEEGALLRGIRHCKLAFVVFETATSRDAAVAALQGAEDLSLQTVACEPDNVNWENFARSRCTVALRLTVGILGITLALLVWLSCFYYPYVSYVTSFQLALGDKPSIFCRFLFTLLVVIGNQIMYLLCSKVADSAGFRFRDTVEMTYIILYMCACVVNVVLDMAVAFYVSYQVLVGLQVRTHDGRRLEELSPMELFESYPLQKALGNQLFWYAFPSCFLVPFLVEPLLTIALPTHISELLVRSHANTKGFKAERAMGYVVQMDFGRYADISLNMLIAASMLLFPGGYTLPIFGCLAVSHIYIYAMDHYRVLRAVPGFVLGSDVVDRCACAMMAIPTGIILSALIMKVHQPLRGTLSGKQTMVDEAWPFIMLAGLFGHVLLHWLLLYFLVPCVGRKRGRAEATFAETGRILPCSWFSSNPVHCLRSRFVYEHAVPCSFYIRGKEHLLQHNPEVGSYFRLSEAHWRKTITPTRR